MKCAGSQFFDLPEQESGDAAEEGTACGELLQISIEDPTVWSELTNTGEWPSHLPTHASNGVPFDEDMKFYIARVVLPAITHWQHPANMKCETRIDWTAHPEVTIRGQSDVMYTMEYDGKYVLCIDDLKYGWGIVEVKENWQLIGYSIGHLMEIQGKGKPVDLVRMRILQPRPHHEDGWCREWMITPDELFKYYEQICAKVKAIVEGDRTLATGKHCKYCPAAAEACPAFSRSAYEAFETIVTEHKQDVLTDKELSTQLDMFERAKEILDIKFRSIKDLAISRIKAGSILSNWTTESSYSDRKWKSSISPSMIEMMTGRKIIKQDMMSPAQAEKLGVNKDLVNSLVDRHFLGQKIVRKQASKMADKAFGNEAPKTKGDK